MDPQAELMLHKAADDRSVLDFALPDAIFGFHAQQAVEKLLKALIAAHNVRYERTHEFKPLLDLIEELGETGLPFSPELQTLQQFAVNFRYDEGPEIEPVKRDEYRRHIDALMKFVQERARVIVPRPLP